MKLHNVVFPQPDSTTGPTPPPRLWDISLVDGLVESIEPAENDVNNEETAPGSNGNDVASHLLLPTLCHPHLHLDKAYLLTSSGCCHDPARADGPGDPDYSDLLPQTGSFAEALQSTAVAKTRFTAADLRRRGLQLLATSCAQGVTTARVFVEVDAQAAGQGTVAVAVARELKALFGKSGSGRLDLQVCAFAQEVLFTGDAGTANRAAIEAVLEGNRHEADEESRTIAVLGVTPYVEATREQSLQNISWAVATALEYGLHLDLHLDYNLNAYSGNRSEAASEPLVFALLEALIRHEWTARTEKAGKTTKPKTVVVGHATQLTCLPRAQLARLAAMIQQNHLPVYFVGLPTSDLYMMGRQPPVAPDAVPNQTPFTSPRGTLPVPTLIREFGLSACLGVNNVGNAFTPYGTGDPLQLACWGVGLYHAGTGRDARLLYGSISWRAREAIGMDGDDAIDWETPIDQPREQLLGKAVGRILAVTNRRYIQLAASTAGGEGDANTVLSRIPARLRLGFRDVVWDPPDISLRTVV